MLKLIKGIFDVRAKGKHRRRASWPKLMLALFIVQAQKWKTWAWFPWGQGDQEYA